MIECILKNILYMFTLFLVIGIIVVIWAGPILMMFLYDSATWLLSYGVTIPIFFGICEWADKE